MSRKASRNNLPTGDSSPRQITSARYASNPPTPQSSFKRRDTGAQSRPMSSSGRVVSQAPAALAMYQGAGGSGAGGSQSARGPGIRSGSGAISAPATALASPVLWRGGDSPVPSNQGVASPRPVTISPASVVSPPNVTRPTKVPSPNQSAAPMLPPTPARVRDRRDKSSLHLSQHVPSPPTPRPGTASSSPRDERQGRTAWAAGTSPRDTVSVEVSPLWGSAMRYK